MTKTLRGVFQQNRYTSLTPELDHYVHAVDVGSKRKVAAPLFDVLSSWPTTITSAMNCELFLIRGTTVDQGFGGSLPAS